MFFYVSMLVKVVFVDRIGRVYRKRNRMPDFAASIGEHENRSCGHTQRNRRRTYAPVSLHPRTNDARVIGRWVALWNRWRHLIYTLGKRKSSYIRGRHSVPKRRNKRTEFYFYLKIDERETQVYFGKLFHRDLFHPLLISRIAIIWIFMKDQPEKEKKNQ